MRCSLVVGEGGKVLYFLSARYGIARVLVAGTAPAQLVRAPVSSEELTNASIVAAGDALYLRLPDRLLALDKVARAETLPSVAFRSGSADLDPSVRKSLVALVADLLKRKTGHVIVVGHTDNLGDRPLNNELSRKRAEAVRAALLKRVFGDTCGSAGGSVPSMVDSGRGTTLLRR